MDDLGILQILYCWQSLLLSVGVSVTTSSFKGAILLQAGPDPIREAWAKQVIIPMIPLILGAFAALIFPIRPDILVKEVQASGVAHPWLVYVAYGAAVGVFADYLFQRVTGMMKVRDAVKDGKEAAKP
jgi:hypothetical protein